MEFTEQITSCSDDASLDVDSPKTACQFDSSAKVNIFFFFFYSYFYLFRLMDSCFYNCNKTISKCLSRAVKIQTHPEH